MAPDEQVALILVAWDLTASGKDYGDGDTTRLKKAGAEAPQGQRTQLNFSTSRYPRVASSDSRSRIRPAWSPRDFLSVGLDDPSALIITNARRQRATTRDTRRAGHTRIRLCARGRARRAPHRCPSPLTRVPSARAYLAAERDVR